MLRRTKEQRKADLKLPPLKVDIVYLELDAAERDFYDCVVMKTASSFDKYVKKVLFFFLLFKCCAHS